MKFLKPPVILLFFLFISNSILAQEMSFEEYNPPSTLKVPEHIVTRAKFPFVDIHSHQGGVNETRIDKAAMANAGFYTFLNTAVQYPFGIKNMNISEDRLKWFLSLKGGIFLGDQDNNPRHKGLPNMRKAKKQGKHRLQRGTNFFNDLVELGVEKNLPFRWRYQIVPGVSHENVGMSMAAAEFLLEDL